MNALDISIIREGGWIMPARKLKEFLDSNQVRYVTISHSAAYTAQEIAAAVHMPGREMAKTVIIKADGKMAMVILPATDHVNFDLLKEALGVGKVELAGELEFKDRFPDCDVGAMPPFGNLYSLEVYVSEALAEDERIGFNAGSHLEIVQMDYKDFERLVKPQIIRISVLGAV